VGYLLHNLKNCCNLCAINFLPIHIYLFFLFVLPGITQPGFSTCSLRRSYNAAGGGGPRLAAPPGPRLAHAFFCCFYTILPVYGNGWQVVLPFMETVGKQFLGDQPSRLWKRLASGSSVYGNGWQAVLGKWFFRLWKRLAR